MKRHNDKHVFVPGTRRTGSCRTIGMMNVGATPPTLTEQGIDVDALLENDRDLIEQYRKGTR